MYALYKKSIRTKTFLSLLFILVAVVSCRSVEYNVKIKATEDILKETNGDYEKASRSLIDYVNSYGKDQLLFMMEAGMLLHSSKDYKTSNKILLAADRKADSMSRSISKEASSYLTNETGLPYRGEDFERVLINMTLGLNFLMLKDYDNALVEFKRVNYRLQVISVESQKQYKQNLMAKYLASIAAEAAGDLNYAYVELKQIHELRAGIAIVGQGLIRLSQKLNEPEDTAKWSALYPNSGTFVSSLKGSGDVHFVFESGDAPVKVSRGRLLDDPNARFALEVAIRTAMLNQNATGFTVAATIAMLSQVENPIPKYIKRPTQVTDSMLVLQGVQNQKVFRMKPVVLEDVDSTIIRNFEDNYPDMQKRMYARIATKIVAVMFARHLAEQASAKYQNQDDFVSQVIGLSAGLLVGVVVFHAEEPDTRCWHALPANYQAGSGRIPSGEYKVKIIYMDNFARVVKEEEQPNVTVSEDAPVMIAAKTYSPDLYER